MSFHRQAVDLGWQVCEDSVEQARDIVAAEQGYPMDVARVRMALETNGIPMDPDLCSVRTREVPSQERVIGEQFMQGAAREAAGQAVGHAD